MPSLLWSPLYTWKAAPKTNSNSNSNSKYTKTLKDALCPLELQRQFQLEPPTPHLPLLRLDSRAPPTLSPSSHHLMAAHWVDTECDPSLCSSQHSLHRPRWHASHLLTWLFSHPPLRSIWLHPHLHLSTCLEAASWLQVLASADTVGFPHTPAPIHGSPQCWRSKPSWHLPGWISHKHLKPPVTKWDNKKVSFSNSNCFSWISYLIMICEKPKAIPLIVLTPHPVSTRPPSPTSPSVWSLWVYPALSV